MEVVNNVRLYDITMKQIIIGALVALAILQGTFAKSQTPDAVSKNVQREYLVMRNGFTIGGLNFVSPLLVIGKFSVEDDGVRFVPYNPVPYPYQNVNPYNHMIKELYVSYSEISIVKKHWGIVIKTTNGKRYRIMVRKPKKQIAIIQPHLAN